MADILREIVDEIGRDYRSALISRMKCFDLVSSIVKYSQEFDCEISHDDLERVLSYRSLEEFAQSLVWVCSKVCQKVQSSKDIEKNRQEEELSRFIEENFCNSSFSLNDVAEHFNMSAAYASSFFKTIMGDTFLNYITKLRMERIKFLLRTTNMKIKDIVESSGYIDVSNFTRKFKAVENMTLSEYRKTFSKENPQKTDKDGSM